jgi:hypothetical protein
MQVGNDYINGMILQPVQGFFESRAGKEVILAIGKLEGAPCQLNVVMVIFNHQDMETLLFHVLKYHPKEIGMQIESAFAFSRRDGAPLFAL